MAIKSYIGQGRPLTFQPRVLILESHQYLKHSFLKNHYANWTQISYEDSLQYVSQDANKLFFSHDQDGRHAHIR